LGIVAGERGVRLVAIAKLVPVSTLLPALTDHGLEVEGDIVVGLPKWDQERR